MKKTFLFVVILLSLFAFTACQGQVEEYPEPMDEANTEEVEIIWVSADYPHYNSVEDLLYTATDVIRGEVLDSRTEWLDIRIPPEMVPEVWETMGIEDDGEGFYVLHTIYRVRVLEVFYGALEVGEIVEIRQEGGALDNTIVYVHQYLDLPQGDELVFFLLESILDLPFMLLNPTQSVYRVSGDRLMGDNGEETLESFHPDNTITLTVDDLRRIQQENFGLTGQ